MLHSLPVLSFVSFLTRHIKLKDETTKNPEPFSCFCYQAAAPRSQYKENCIFTCGPPRGQREPPEQSVVFVSQRAMSGGASLAQRFIRAKKTGSEGASWLLESAVTHHYVNVHSGGRGLAALRRSLSLQDTTGRSHYVVMTGRPKSIPGELNHEFLILGL